MRRCGWPREMPKRRVITSQALRFEKPAAERYISRGPIRESTAPFMTGSKRTALVTSGKNAARIAFAGAVIAGCSVGLAAQAVAEPGSNCDPFYLSMTPQPVLSCLAPEPAAPVEGAPGSEPVNDVASPLLPAELPPPVDPAAPPPPDPLVPSG
jgi:hypothetical protein